jgi:hypothetical protein
MKASRLSLAAIAALGITVSATANDIIPITLSSSNWKMIGVNGGFSENSGSLTSVTGTETVNNNLFTGISTSSSTTDTTTATDIVKFMVINHNGLTEPNSASMTVYTSGHSYSLTAQERPMYISSDGSGIADIKILYQDHLEGETFGMKINGVQYEGVFASTSTQENPGNLATPTVSVANAEFDILDTIDLEIANNPGFENASSGTITDYTKSSNKDAIGGNSTDALRVYNYNASAQRWDSFRYGNTNNDFTTWEPGKSYWVKLTDGAGTNAQPGIILGSDGITSTTHKTMVDSGEITNGWNMLSFDNKPLRYSGTGLILGISSAAANAEFTIFDENGVQSVLVIVKDLDSSGAVNVADVALSVNSAVSMAKANGTVSENFNVKAFTDGADLILLSDRAFRINDLDSSGIATNDVFDSVVTLGNQAPLTIANPGVSAEIQTYKAVSDLGVVAGGSGTPTVVQSRYGEYSLIVKPNISTAGALTGPLLAANGDVGAIRVNDNTKVDLNGTTVTNLAGIVTRVTGDADIDHVVSIDLDHSGVADTIIITDKDERFYIRDHTFTRVYTVDTTATTTATDTFTITSGNNGADGVGGALNAGTNTAAQFATDLAAGHVVAKEIDTTTVAVFTDTLTEKDFDVKDIALTDLLTLSSSSDDLAKGAIKEVYSVSDIAKADVNKTVYRLVVDTVIADTETLDMAFDTDGEIVTNKTTITQITGTTATTAVSTAATASVIASAINTAAVASNLDVYAEASGSTITVSGYGLAIGGALTGAGGTNAAGTFCDGTNDFISDTAGDIITCATSVLNLGGVINVAETTTLVSDLKYSPVYSPEFPVDENAPIQSLNSAGKEVVKMLSPVESGSSIAWSYIDLTKAAQDGWFNIEDSYNLFNTDRERGYWVYLKDADSNPLSFDGNVSVIATYIHHFNNDVNNTTSSQDLASDNIISSGSISVEVSGLSGNGYENVVATLGNNKIPLVASGNFFSADFSTAELPFGLASKDYNLTVSAFDEFGNVITSSAIPFDNKAPANPTVSISGKNLTITSLDATMAHIYAGNINESNPTPTSLYPDNTDTTYMGSFDIGNTINYCAMASDFDSNLTGWRLYTVDGDGNPDNSRVSNIALVNPNETTTSWYPVYKNASVLVTSGGETDINATTFDSSCEKSATLSTDNGVYLQNLTADKNISIAYETPTAAISLNGIGGVDKILESFIKIDGVLVAKISINKELYTINTSGIFLINYNGKIYRTTLSALYNSDAGNPEDSPIVLSSASDVYYVAGQTISEK